jgi:hypothetical protein
MSLTPSDMLKIQSAIDAYEKKFPRKPSPTAAEALAWQASKGKRKVNPADQGAEGTARGSFWQSLLGRRKRTALLQS